MVACEGETEKRYLTQLFRSVPSLQDNVNLRFASPKGTNLRSLVRAADRELAAIGKIGSAAAWVVCDLDNSQPQDFDKAASWLAKSSSHGIALTNPCIEYWFLTYVQMKPDRYNKCEDYAKALVAEVPGYSKKQSGSFPPELLDWAATGHAVDRGWKRLAEIRITEKSTSIEALEAVWRSENRSTIPFLFNYVANKVNRRVGNHVIDLSPKQGT